MFSPACICVCSAEDPRVGGDLRRPAGVQLLPAGAERRDRRQGKRKDDHLLATGRDRQPMTKHLGEEGMKKHEGNEGADERKEVEKGTEEVKLRRRPAADGSFQTNCKNERRRE